MQLEWLSKEFAVAKWTREHKIEELGEFSFWSRTDQELSLVCPTECLPQDVEKHEDGWVGFRVVGQMDFSLVGILAGISGCLAEKDISIFAVSTFDTDYIFIKKDNVLLAQKQLELKGWNFKNKK
ncbi:ACT domain-containing protein [Anaerotignum sp.]|uniref:ACT domain-containing protein n=1 Tax=Anaerotignum sp. TaxID=2039241 RepID=UPI0027154DF5|nr:ACT domain-containing protein [Anaerotignum sp.]